MGAAQVFEKDRVAVVTGAGLGIGLAVSKTLAARGMKVVMADLPSDDFDRAVQQVAGVAPSGVSDVLPVPTDVADPAQADALKDATIERFGSVELLINNAVTRIGRGFDAPLGDWRHAMDVNLWGPIYTTQGFLPGMLAANRRCAIVNVGSKQGITNPPGHPVYNMSKSALKTYTEVLEHDLRTRCADAPAHRVSAHLLVPGWTTTGHAEHKDGAWLPQQVVDLMIARISRGDFYIVCPDGEVSSEMDNHRILWGAQDITENRPPLSRWHPDFKDKARDAGA